jgi:hypothetical protein
MSDRIMALVGLAALVAFLLPLVLFVPHLDLIFFVCVCVLLAGYDFWTELWRRNQ